VENACPPFPLSRNHLSSDCLTCKSFFINSCSSGFIGINRSCLVFGLQPISGTAETLISVSSSKRCRRLPCNYWGSSFGIGIQASKRSSKKDIPPESSCPYQNEDRPNNQTQIPLRNGCHQDGTTKVVEYEYFKSVDELPSFIDQNHPVIGGFTLSPGYYETKAFLSVADDKKLGQTDSNKGGHAFNIIGYLELPKSLHRDEGKRCYIAANSWGYGWGAGGHSCISEAWLKKHFKGAFYSIKAVK
jgi:hypothetical protein